ncbi:MAG: flagellar motor switch phosphatase FliY [Bacillota bacterium]
MSERNMLSQEEIDALLKATGGVPGEEGKGLSQDREGAVRAAEASSPDIFDPGLDLTQEERDALGEIGNISMGSAATTLSELLRQRVTITSPKVTACMQEKLFAGFKVPYILIQVDFKTGLQGFNVLIIQAKDAAVIADLMMGGDGTKPSEQISELELSAASEAMNQMIGTASTSLSAIFQRTISISPPQTTVLEVVDGVKDFRLPTEDPIVAVAFRMKVGELLDTEIMQIMSIHTAREEAGLLLGQVTGEGPAREEGEPAAEAPAPSARAEADQPAVAATPGLVREAPQPARAEAAAALALERGEAPSAVPEPLFSAAPLLTTAEQRRLELLLNIPLKISVILGRTKRPIKEVLSLTPGAIVELSSQVDEPVEILVNGTLIARGEVVAVNENFGVRITSIISPRERIEQLGAGQP